MSTRTEKISYEHSLICKKKQGIFFITLRQKPFMPYPGVSGFFDAEGRGLEQDGAPQCAKNAEIRRFLVCGKVPPA